MSEIKVGDKIKAGGHLMDMKTGAVSYYPEGIKGTVLKVIEYTLHVECYTPMGINQIFHCSRLQCRKLVKVKKCEKCKGLGCYQRGTGLETWECDKCNGKGKVKV